MARDWFEETPSNNAEWLDYSDFWWHEIVGHCGLDTSFVGEYADDAAISYAKSWHQWRLKAMGYPRLERAPFQIEVGAPRRGRPGYRWVQGWIVKFNPQLESTAMRRNEALSVYQEAKNA